MKKMKLLSVLLVGMNCVLMGQMWTAQDALLKLEVAGLCLYFNMDDDAVRCVSDIKEGLMYTCAVKVHYLRDYSGLAQYDVTPYLNDFYNRISKPKTGFCAQLDDIDRSIKCGNPNEALGKISSLMRDLRCFTMDKNEERINSLQEWYLYIRERVLRLS